MAIITLNVQGEVLEQNPMFKQLFGTGERIISNIFLEKEFQPVAQSVHQCFSERQNSNGVFIFPDDNGNFLHIKYNLFPIFNRRQNVEHILATFETINSLDRSFIISGIGYWEYNADTDALYFCEETEKMIGASAAEIPSIRKLIRFINKKDRRKLIKNLRSPAPNSKFDFKLRTIGEPAWMRVEIKGFEDDAWSGIVCDITEWKKKEEEYLRSQHELEAFMYKSAHNLKGPAGSIHALTKIAISEVRDETALRYLKLIDKSSERLESIINDLMNLNKIKQSRLEINEINLSEIISSARENLKFLEGVDQIDFQVDLAHSQPLRSDVRYVYSIFQNLIENAIKYKGARDPFLKIKSEDAAGGIRFLFQDNGIGIPDTAGEKIFEMFYRAADSQQGSGLGLYIVKSAVRKLGGTINLQSKVGVGTTFILFLPQH